MYNRGVYYAALTILAAFPSVTRLFSCIHRLEQAPVQTAEEEAAHLERKRLEGNALRRQRYANNPEFRQRHKEYLKRYKRDPIHRADLRARPRGGSQPQALEGT
ncbi:hypothetical protein KCU62_g3884, partial [Aureobasidium sp. EXF-3399]